MGSVLWFCYWVTTFFLHPSYAWCWPLLSQQLGCRGSLRGPLYISLSKMTSVFWDDSILYWGWACFAYHFVEEVWSFKGRGCLRKGEILWRRGWGGLEVGGSGPCPSHGDHPSQMFWSHLVLEDSSWFQTFHPEFSLGKWGSRDVCSRLSFA